MSSIGQRRGRRNGRETDDDEPQRKDWVREVHRTARTSGRVLAPPELPASPVADVPRPAKDAPATTSGTQAPAKGPEAASRVADGVFAIVVNPSSAAFDAAAVADYAAALTADGVRGVVCGSVMAEADTMDVAERKSHAEAWVRAGFNVVVDVSANNSRISVALAGHAASIGAAAVALSIPRHCGNALNEADVISYIGEVARATTMPVFFHYRGETTFRPSEVLRGLSTRAPSARGVIFEDHNVSELAACLAVPTVQVIAAEDSVAATAAILGVKSFASVHYSVIAPLAAKIIAAAQKSDSAALGKLLPLAAQFHSLVARVANQSALRQRAVAKCIASLRLERDLGHLPAPAPRLTLSEMQSLRADMAAFVAAYSAAAGPAPAAPPSSKSSINVKALPGFLGQLDDKIRERALRCGRAADIDDVLAHFPHLGRRWRGKLPEADCDVARFIDHTILKPEATEAEITKLTAEARKHNFFAVCVNGCRVEQCMQELSGSSVRVAAVIGFPLGAMTINAKAREAREIVRMGAAEIDMVMNVGAMKDGNLRYVYEDIKAVVEASRPAIVKVIFESCLLTADEIMDASILSVAAGAGFLKTSTGFNKGGATPEAIDIMLAVAGNQCEVKASGGVRTGPDSLAYITAGVRRIGTSSGVAIVTGAASGGGY